MPDNKKQLVCHECHKHCEDILRLRLGKAGNDLGMVAARQQGRKTDYHDGLMDGIKEAIGALRCETGLYWDELRKQRAKI